MADSQFRAQEGCPSASEPGPFFFLYDSELVPRNNDRDFKFLSQCDAQFRQNRLMIVSQQHSNPTHRFHASRPRQQQLISALEWPDEYSHRGKFIGPKWSSSRYCLLKCQWGK